MSCRAVLVTARLKRLPLRPEWCHNALHALKPRGRLRIHCAFAAVCDFKGSGLGLLAGETQLAEPFKTPLCCGSFGPGHTLTFTDERVIVRFRNRYCCCFSDGWETSILFRCARPLWFMLPPCLLAEAVLSGVAATFVIRSAPASGCLRRCAGPLYAPHPLAARRASLCVQGRSSGPSE